jgi:hypothetical protein
MVAESALLTFVPPQWQPEPPDPLLLYQEGERGQQYLYFERKGWMRVLSDGSLESR